MAENPRIEELRRRVQKDPASIAFAQLAEEFRRAGRFEEAIPTCQAGLAIHPGYLSARVTLGRSLIETSNLDAAQAELQEVLQHAPENLAAIRGVAEIHHRRSEISEALKYYRLALTLARHDPDLEQTVDELSRAVATRPSEVEDGLTFEEATAELLMAADRPAPVSPALSGLEQFLRAIHDYQRRMPSVPVALLTDPALPGLQRFLSAIHTYRQRKTV